MPWPTSSTRGLATRPIDEFPATASAWRTRWSATRADKGDHPIKPARRSSESPSARRRHRKIRDRTARPGNDALRAGPGAKPVTSRTPDLPTTNRIARNARLFWNDTRGVILPYVTIMLVAVVGVAVLALDGARFMSLQTQLQNGADALALAGAAELDRLPDSENRAISAINNLVTNSSVFGA